MRQALVDYFAGSDRYDVVGTAGDGAEAVRLCIEHQPEAALVDLRMPRLSGTEATRQISHGSPETRIIALTTFDGLEYILPVLRAGASGYLLKDSSPDEIVACLDELLENGGRYAFSPGVVERLAQHAVEEPESAPVLRTPADVSLTEREAEVVRLLAQGLSNKEISQQMYVSEGSVKAYIGRICAKLNVRDRLQVLIRAYEVGLVNPRLPEDQA